MNITDEANLEDVAGNKKKLEQMLKTMNIGNKGQWLKEMGMSDHVKEFSTVL